MINKKILFSSFFFTIILSFIPEIGIRIDGEYYFFGFPAQWLVYYANLHAKWRFSFEWLGLLFNIAIIYFLILFLDKVRFKLSNTKKD